MASVLDPGLTGSAPGPPTRRWPEVKTLLADALELDGVEREAYLAARCADAETRRQIDALLAFDTEAPLVDSAWLGGRPADSAPGEGSRLGAYRLRRRLPSGGMGDVYEAEREADFSQTVAIKLLRPGLLHGDGIERFDRERRVLAELDHPNIARLLDGGSAPDGRPYMVLEWVDGAPIDRACDERRLGIRERVEWFRHVCDAIGFAHRNLVIHRDLKPENVLVSRDGVPKLLDFGIAKLLQPTAHDRTTRGPLRPLTPRYASPEQWSGSALSTTSDVYSAGLMLAELLLGPFDADERGRIVAPIVQIRRRLRAPGDIPPSLAEARGTQPAELCRAVRGDLEAILDRALQADAADRTASIDAVRDDLQRWLHGYPVRARRVGALTRAAKLARRRPWTVGFALVASILVLGLSVYSTRQSRLLAIEAEHAAERTAEAVASRDRQIRLNRVLIDLFDFEALRERGLDTTSSALLLDRGSEIARQRLVDDDETLARAHVTFGHAYEQIGFSASAAGQYDDALRLATASGFRPRELVALHFRLGRASSAVDRLAEAAEAFRRGAELAEQHAVEVDLQIDLLARWARVLWRDDQPQAARRVLERAIHHRTEASGEHHPRTVALAKSHAFITGTDDHQQVADLSRARAMLAADACADPELPLAVLDGLSEVHRAQGRLDEAYDVTTQWVAGLREALGGEHPRVGRALLRQAQLAARRGDHEAARSAWQTAAALVAIADPEDRRYPEQVAAVAEELRAVRGVAADAARHGR